MSDANKRARIEYLQSIYRASEAKLARCREVLEHIAVYCEAEPQTSAQAIIAKLAREALAFSPQHQTQD